MDATEYIKQKINEGLTNSQIYKLYEDYSNISNTKIQQGAFERKVRKIRAKTGILSTNESKIILPEIKENEVKVTEEQSKGIYNALVTSTFIKTPEQLIEYLGIDENIWILSKFTRNVWGSETNPSFQIKGEFKEKVIKLKDSEIIKIYSEAITNFNPTKSSPSLIKNNSGNMLELALVDHHFGQQSLASETGEEYNLEIAKTIYMKALYNLLEQSKNYKVEKIVFLIGSDFFNVDTTNNTTYAGTYQAESSRWKDTFRQGMELCISAIELCKKYANTIEVPIVQGNHDFTRSFYLGLALTQRYNNDNTVNINSSDMPRKYIEYGNSLICMTHGDTEVKGKLPLIMSREKPDAWAKAKFIEAHCGHLHKEKESVIIIDEDVSIKVRVLPSLVGLDDWHNSKGYKHIRESQAFVWNKEQGNIAVFKYHV